MSSVGHAQIEKFKALALQTRLLKYILFRNFWGTQKVCLDERTSEARELKAPQRTRKLSENWHVMWTQTQAAFQKFQGPSVFMLAG